MNRFASILPLLSALPFLLSSAIPNSWAAPPPPDGTKAKDACDVLYRGAINSTGKATSAPPKNVRELRHGDHVYLYYRCKNCQQNTISSPLLDGKMGCAKCGAPHTNEEFLLPSQDDLLREEQLMKTPKDLEIAKSGKAWNCSYCTGSNYAIYSHCRSCGAPRAAEAAVQGASVKSATTASTRPSSTAQPHSVSPTSNRKLMLGAAVGATAIAGAGIWAMQSTELPGTLSSMEWRHTLEQQRFTKVTRSDWEDAIQESSPVMPSNGGGEKPGAFNIRGCFSKQYGLGPQYVCGKETKEESYEELICEKCVDCHIEDNGNGTGTQVCENDYETKTREVEVDKLCQDPIYKPYCDYDTYEWQRIDSKSLSGSGPGGSDPLPWPKLWLGVHDRSVPSAEYRLRFSYKHKGKPESHSMTVPSEADFKSWKPGENVTIVRRNLGTVSEVKRAPAQ